MNILYYLINYPKLSESFIQNEIRELERRGHDVAVFAMHEPNERVRHEETERSDAQVHHARNPGPADAFDLVSARTMRPRVLKEALYRADWRTHAALLHYADQCIRFVERLPMELDVVHTHFAESRTYGAKYVAAYFDVPFTVTTHAYDLYAAPDVAWLNRIFGKADRIVTVSEYNRSHIERRCEVTTPIDVVPAAIDVEKFQPTGRTEPNRLLSVGRLVEKKGFEYAVEAVSRLVERNPDLEYRIVGTGSRRAALEAQIATLDLQETVTLLDTVSDDDLVRELDRASVFVLPSVVAADGNRDSTPVVLKEAMAMGTACVSTTTAAIPEVITHEHDGLLVDPKDAPALARAIERLLDDERLRDDLGRNGRATAEATFRIENAVADLEAVFETAARSRRGA